MDDLIKRERRQYWVPSAQSVGLGRQIEKEERALALATMANGLRVASLTDADGGVLPRWNFDRHPAVFRAMTGSAADEVIEPLTPDIVGEFFVLQLIEKAQAARTVGAEGGGKHGRVMAA